MYRRSVYRRISNEVVSIDNLRYSFKDSVVSGPNRSQNVIVGSTKAPF